MRRLLRNALAVAGGGAAMLVLDALGKRRGARRNLTQLLLDLMRPAPVADDTVETRVRNKLARTATDPDSITVSIERGCVDLRGNVPTRERARIVRAIATVPGVDSVLDLMTEPPPMNEMTARPSKTLVVPPRGAAASRRPTVWTPAARIAAVGGGLGLTIAGLRIGGLFALPTAAAGLLLLAVGATAASRPRGEPREPHPGF